MLVRNAQNSILSKCLKEFTRKVGRWLIKAKFYFELEYFLSFNLCVFFSIFKIRIQNSTLVFFTTKVQLLLWFFSCLRHALTNEMICFFLYNINMWYSTISLFLNVWLIQGESKCQKIGIKFWWTIICHLKIFL